MEGFRGNTVAVLRTMKKPRTNCWARLSWWGQTPMSGLGRRCRGSGRERARGAAGGAWWRMGARCFYGLGGRGRVRERTGIGAGSSGRGRRFGRRVCLAVMGRHAVLRQAQLVAINLCRPGGPRRRLSRLGSGFGRRGWQLGCGEGADTGSAQSHQGRTGEFIHGAKPHTCAG